MDLLNRPEVQGHLEDKYDIKIDGINQSIEVWQKLAQDWKHDSWGFEYFYI